MATIAARCARRFLRKTGGAECLARLLFRPAYRPENGRVPDLLRPIPHVRDSPLFCGLYAIGNDIAMGIPLFTLDNTAKDGVLCVVTCSDALEAHVQQCISLDPGAWPRIVCFILFPFC